jgi:hypothetical protein
VKSRLTRGRDALRRLLTGYVKEVGQELGLDSVEDEEPSRESNGDNGLEVTS